MVILGSNQENMPKVSIIIPTYNRREIITSCLTHIDALICKDFDVIVIDDGSKDDTTETIRSLFPTTTLIINDTPKGPAAARNQGIKIAQSNYIWFLDSDSVVSPECLSQMIKLMDENPQIGCLGGELLLENGMEYVRIDSENESYKMPVDRANFTNLKLVKVRTLASCNLFTRKELLYKIGGFDEEYFYIAEDADLCKRTHKLGFDIICDHRAMVLHEYRKEQRKSNFFRLYKNEIRSAIKNDGSIKGLLYEPLRIIKNSLIAARSVSLENTEIRIMKNSNSSNKIQIAAKVCISLISAYIWNIANYFKTLNSRNTRYI